MPQAQELDVLQRLYEQKSQEITLNIEMRKALHQHAAAKGFELDQDCAGNVYLSRTAKDHTIANIAIAFPLDVRDSSRSFTDAVLAFGQLRQEDVACGLTLMGYTSLHGEDVGLEAWENAITIPGTSSALSKVPLFDQFSKSPSPSTFAFSAIFRISESTDAPLSLFGSSILIAKAQHFVEGREGVRVGTQEFRRAPRLVVEGLGADEVIRKTVCAYSKYVVALFDNFD
ncbi:hypothetical protein F4803DRAFT_534202 [Xylaria telfairii]|nr:hypothetical protein F4803DRAFT_534202 [Xylaria telfairii]